MKVSSQDLKYKNLALKKQKQKKIDSSIFGLELKFKLGKVIGGVREAKNRNETTSTFGEYISIFQLILFRKILAFNSIIG